MRGFRVPAAAAWPIRRAMLLAGCVAVGCAVCAIMLPPRSLLVLAAAFLLTLVVPICRRPTWMFVAVLVALLLCLGGVYRLRVVTPCESLDGQRDAITAVVQETPNGHLVAATIIAADKAPIGTRVLLYCPEQAMPSRYETVQGEVAYRALYKTQGRYRADGIFLQAYPTAYGEEAFAISPREPSFATAMESIRERLLDELRTRLPGEDGALLAGLCLGDLRDISDTTETAFRRAGLPHLLVVSGLHLSVIGGGAYVMLRLLLRRRRSSAIAAMMVVLFFSALVGFSPSVVRAGIACCVMLVGQCFHRRPDGLNSLGLALLLLVAATPYCLFDAGLLLSFGATAGILCLYRPLCDGLRLLPRWLASGLAVTLAASLPIWPLLAYLFGEVSLVSPLANLLAVAPSSVSLILGCLAMLFSVIPPLAFLADVLVFLSVWPVKWICLVAKLLGGLPIATLPVIRVWLLIYLTGACGLGILCIYRRNRRMMRLLVAVFMSLLVFANGLSGVMAADAVSVMVSSRRESTVFLLEYGTRRGLLVMQAESLYADARLLRLCESGLDFVVVGDGASADTARLTNFLHRVPVKRVVVGGNRRWLTGLDMPVTLLTADRALPLWNEITLTTSPTDGWRLDCRGATLALCPSGETCVADAAVFVDDWPPDDNRYAIKQAVLVGEASTETAPSYAVMAFTDGDCYFTARGGEWSVAGWR